MALPFILGIAVGVGAVIAFNKSDKLKELADETLEKTKKNLNELKDKLCSQKQFLQNEIKEEIEELKEDLQEKMKD